MNKIKSYQIKNLRKEVKQNKWLFNDVKKEKITMLNKIKSYILKWLGAYKLHCTLFYKIKALEEIVKGNKITMNIKMLEDRIKELEKPYYISHKEDIKRLFEKINTLNTKVNKHINLTN